MIFTDRYGFPCPSEQDYGAIALAMQAMANKVEETALAQRAKYERFNEQPTSIWVTFVDSANIPNTGTASPGWTNTASTHFFNYVITAGIGITTQGFPMSGIYHIGWFINTTSVGAVTNDSFRQLIMTLRHDTPTGEEIVANIDRRVQEENIAGGNFFGADAIIRIGSDFQNYSVDAFFSHTNGTDMVIETGATAWWTRLGSEDLIEVTS